MDSQGVIYRKGYLSTDKECTTRIHQIGYIGYISIKSRTEKGQRTEFEYPIPGGDANLRLNKICE